MNTNIAITGVSGFLGRNLAQHMMGCERTVLSLGRSVPDDLVDRGLRHVCVPDFSVTSEYSDVLSGIDCVIHCAAMAGGGKNASERDLELFRNVNVQGAVQLAKLSAERGVKRFIFISSAKVFGETSPQGRPFGAADTPAPEDVYAVSKYEAEQGLIELCDGLDMELVIVRPPLVYGPGVKANFQKLIKLCRSGIPLPFNSVDNRRTMVYIENLVSFITRCIDEKSVAGKTLLPADNHDVSLSQLLATIDKYSSKKSRVFSFSPKLLSMMLRMIGKREIEKRLLDSLQIDCKESMTLLNWQPPVSWDQAVERTVSNYINEFQG